ASSCASPAPGTTPPRPGPPAAQPLLPGPVGMYAAAILTFWLPAFAYGLLVRLVSPGPAADDGSGAPSGRAGGSCAGSWFWDPGGAGSSSAAATASETASSAASTWPSSNAPRSSP